MRFGLLRPRGNIGLALLYLRTAARQPASSPTQRAQAETPNLDGDATFLGPDVAPQIKGRFRPANDATGFEIYCLDLLRSSGWSASHIGASGDQGADIEANHSGVRVVLQCKLYGTAVGNRSVQEVYAAKAHYQADLAYVVCDAGFTPAARSLASSTGVQLIGSSDLKGLHSTLGLSGSRVQQTRHCPSCKAKLRLPGGRSGTVKCPTCSHRFQAYT